MLQESFSRGDGIEGGTQRDHVLKNPASYEQGRRVDCTYFNAIGQLIVCGLI